MKKLLVIMIMLLFTAAFAYAGPWLWCEPPGESVDGGTADGSQVEFDGTWLPADAIRPGCTLKELGCVYTDPDDGIEKYLLRDNAGVSDGLHILKARWVSDLWGEIGPPSDPYNLTRPVFQKPVLGATK